VNSTICLIPARLNSTRLPRKILLDLSGKPLLQRVYEAATRCPFKEVVIAVDDEEVFERARSFGARVIMTSKAPNSGTERLIEAIEKEGLKADRFVNWQADEPFIQPATIETLLKGEGDVWTLRKRLNGNPLDPNTVKVVVDPQGLALFFSRAPIAQAEGLYFQHIGIYAYSAEALSIIKGLPQSQLSNGERLEQLRFLEAHLKIRVNTTDQVVVGIDTADDLANANRLFTSL